MAEPSPAPLWTTASWPASASSRTPAGVRATRYSSALISVGTPTLIAAPSSSHELASPQRQPELDAVAGARQVASRQLLNLADPVAQRVAVTVQPLGGALPLAVLLDEGLERAHELAAVVALAVLDGPEDRVAEQPQSVVVLEGEQELEGAEVPVGRGAVGAGAVVAGVPAQAPGLE